MEDESARGERLRQGVRGWNLCRTLRGLPTLRTTPITLLTVWDKGSRAILGPDAGATRTRRKAADPETLVATIDPVLGQEGTVSRGEANPR